jgi:PPE-repeat protein
MNIPLPPIWMAAPPEVHSALLTTGFTPAGIELAAGAWAQLAAQYIAASAELQGIIGQVQTSYQGPSAEKFAAAHQPYLVWLDTAATKAGLAAAAHTEAAASYVSAVAAMPTLAELAENHVVHGALWSTNFFGVNTVPIGMNEADYMRMWNQAAAVMAGWDTASTMASDSIPPTPMAPMLVLPGVGEAGAAAASAAETANLAQGQLAGALLNSADLAATAGLADRAATSPASAAGKVPVPRPVAQSSGSQQLQPENMANGVMQQMASMGPQLAQSAGSALQGAGPQQLLSSAPQLLSSAPQTLGQLLTNFTGASPATGGAIPGMAGAGGGMPAAMPVGFSGTAAIGGINPAGLTSLAGGAYGSGATRPLLPSTWGATATTTGPAAEPRPVLAAAGLASASSGSGGGAMMGSGAARRTTSPGSAHAVSSYSDEDDDEAIDEFVAQVRGAAR